MNIALIVFAGSGTRMHTSVPKQFVKVNGQELVVYTIKKFEDNPNIDEIVLVTSKEYFSYVQEFKDKYDLKKVVKVVEGGASRQESVKLGLLATNYDNNDNVLIHDGDRPLVSHSIINQCILYLDEFQAVCPVLNITDRLNEVSNSGRARLVNNQEVDIQTPQAIKYGLIKSKHIEYQDKTFSDDIGLVEDSVEVKFFLGEPTNFKITQDKDLVYFEKILQ